MHNRRNSGAASSETIILVTVIAIVLLIALTVFGQKIAVLFKSTSKSLDRGSPTKRDSALSTLDIYTDTSLANPRGTTNATLAAANAVPTLGNLPFDPAITEPQRNRLLAALNRLPAAVRDAGIVGVTQQGAQNAFFNPGTNRVEFGGFAVTPDGDQHINDFLYVLTGQNQNWSLERVLYHEMIHAVQHNNPALANSFLNIGYNAKYNALQADPALAPAQAAQQAALQALIAAHVPPPPMVDGAGNLNTDALEAVERANPQLAANLFAANQTLTNIVTAHGLPSRFPGDTHAGGDSGQSLNSGRAEYFAMVMETARHAPDTFADWRRRAADADPTNDVLSQAEIDWVDAHPELLR